MVAKTHGAGGLYPLVGFDQQLSTELANEILCKLARMHLDQVGEPGWIAAGQFIADCIGSGCLSPLFIYDPDVSDLDAGDQFHLRQCLAFFKKRTDVDLGIDRSEAAMVKFMESEESCRLTNSAFLAHSQGRFDFAPRVAAVLYRSQQKICDALARRFPRGAPTLDEIRVRFGPGSTAQHPKKTACAPIKLARVPTFAANTIQLAPEMLSSTGWADGLLLDHEFGTTFNGRGYARVQPGLIQTSVLRFVPKSAKIYRTMNQEPTANGMWQLGLGELLADVLRMLGIDIQDQSANQRAALYGSLNDWLATIDLSSASDTIALRLVEYLFPRDWYDLLWQLSTRQCTLPGGRIIDLEKVSTMGNGFTFPLETLIFWALSTSCQDLTANRRRSRVLVYGDDIIIGRDSVGLLKEVFSAVGFTINTAKSFVAGRFRESCGKDYADGTDVRPYNLNCDPVNEDEPLGEQAVGAGQFFGLHNFYVRRGLHSFAHMVEDLIHPSIRTRGPDGFGDGHLIGPYVPKRCGKEGSVGFSFSTWGFNPRALKAEVFNQLVQRRKTKVFRFIGNTVGPCAQLYREVPTTVQEWAAVRRKLAIRVATYCTYVRERPARPEGLAGVLYDRAARLDALGLVARERTDDDIWVTPGRGPLRRMSVRMFAGPSYAMN